MSANAVQPDLGSAADKDCQDRWKVNAMSVRGVSYSSEVSNTSTLVGTDTKTIVTDTDTVNEDQSETHKRTPSFFRRRLDSVWTQKRQAADDGDARGRLGLRLLHASPQPLIDIVFVHGLRGGSTRTWRKGTDPRLFWPQHWLPMEPDLRNANIHTFGYDSDWGSTRPSFLNVHDFGQALYEELRTSPFLRQSPGSPIILVGHSMGGLVIKKAVILAHQDAVHRDIAERVKCTFFLATPHRGSDYAAVLNRILKVYGITGGGSSREYIADITRGSTATQLINDDFGRYASELAIFSFYETVHTNLGVSSSLIVDKESAVLGLGFRNETARYMNANHREICKFDSPTDSNYLALKNTLASAVQDLLRDAFDSYENKYKDQLRNLQALLGAPGLSEENHDRLEGSCQWIENRDDFKEWRDAAEELDCTEEKNFHPSIYWVTASPGAGKTVLSSHVQAQLEDFQLQHAVHYFHIGKKASQSLASLLRSLAFQMAVSNATVCDCLLKLYNEGTAVDQDDARGFWSRIFRMGIFQTRLFTPQYWVIDAMDECIKYAEFFALIKGTQSRFPLKIFITSRKLPDFQKLVRLVEGCPLTVVEIPAVDTMHDISLFVESRIDLLPIDHHEEKETLRRDILSKSGGSFLWVRLVMDELEGVYGYESILSVLQGIPAGMMPYYRRTILEMGNNQREKHIAKAILLWVVSATRPLSISELSEAIKMDIKVHLPSAKSAIEGLCGQLVSVDKTTNLIQIVHATAREFLLSEDAGEFQLKRTEAHGRVVLTCLQLLISPTMQPPRHRQLLGQKRPQRESSALLEYSITQFSEHLFGAPSENDKILVALERFLLTTVLSWIERIASQKATHSLLRVARNIKGYLDRRAKYYSPLSRQVRTVEGWSTDLSRLATKYGPALALQPLSIYFLIPPLCPPGTAIFRQFGRSPDGLRLSGLMNHEWDDCAATINFEDETAAAVNCANNSIAIGFESGSITLYNHMSCQKELSFGQDSPIERLLVDPFGNYIASSSMKFLFLWDTKGKLLWKNRLRSRCILIASCSDSVMAVTMSGRAFRWDIDTGDLLEELRYPYQPLDPDSTLQSDLVKAPFTGSFSPGHELLALAYRTGPVCIFELQSHSWIAWAIDDISRNVSQLLFNPHPELNLLLVAYDEGHISLYDSWSGVLVHSYESEDYAVLDSLSCAPDGRTFATVDVLGNLRIWDFESLTVLYHVLTPTHPFRVLDFTPDGFNLIDVVDHEMRLWSPSTLVRKTVEEEASISDQATVLPVAQGQFEGFRSAKIRCMVPHELHPVIFVGNHNGDVFAYNPKAADQPMALYSNSNTMVKHIALTTDNLIASGDINGTVQIWQLNMSQPTRVRAEQLLFQVEVTEAICQLLFDSSGQFLLISSTERDRMYEMKTRRCVGTLSFKPGERRIWRWANFPGADCHGQFTLLCDHELVHYHASSFTAPLDSSLSTRLNYTSDEGFRESAIDSITVHEQSRTLILDIRQQNGNVSNSHIFMFRLPDPPATTQHRVLTPFYLIQAYTSMHFIGVNESDGTLVFLHQNSWVSSVDLVNPDFDKYVQHFFVPSEFVTNSSDVLPVKTADGSVAFCVYDRLACVGNGLKFREWKTDAWPPLRQRVQLGGYCAGAA
ncbi:hypothetical protein PG985_002032 [Apiospora marii]|uniref:GPI inositol-deacylase n=1 Tax=Apiospora marii TaxID=335849 RepID=A0ABR1RYF1_9PEZI